MNPEQAQALFDQGKITQTTLDTVMSRQPSFDTPLDTSLDNSVPIAPAPLVEPELVPPTPLMAPVEPVEPVAPMVPITPEAPLEPQYAPGTVVDTTATQKVATDRALEAQDALDASFEAQQAAAEEQAQAGAAEAAQAYGFNKENQRLESEAANAEKVLRDRGNSEIEQRMAELDAKTEELSNRKYEGYWANKSVGQKILGAISLALGAYSSSLGGGPNHAMNIINGAMEEDFNAFQANTKVKLDAISKSRLSVADKRKLVADQIIGLQAKKLSDINVVRSKISNLSNKFKGPENKAKLTQLEAQLDQKQAEARLKFENALAETVQTQTKRVIAGGTKALSSKEKAQNAALEVSGFGQARTKEEAIKFRDQKTSTEIAMAAGDRIRALGKDINLSDRQKRAKIKTELGLIQGSMRLELIGPGAVTDAEREFMQDLIGDPSKVFGLESIETAKLNTILNKLDGALESRAKNVIIGYSGKEDITPPVIREINGVRYKFDPVTKQNLGAE